MRRSTEIPLGRVAKALVRRRGCGAGANASAGDDDEERYNAIVNRSPKDLNHPKLYKQEASPLQGTHSLTLLSIFDLESHNPISRLLGLLTFILTFFSAIVLGYAEELVHRRHIFLPRSLRLGTPFKVLWTIVKESDLNIGAVCGDNSYSRDKKRNAGGLSGRWKTKSQSTMKGEAKAVSPNRLRRRKSIRGTKPSSN
ncbi:hypothetical protein PIB30_060460 [Stylosanthes scabra]|uniref:Uncharacterized protein n=1 Tax=Stylosanthes scabra TaxID=79078 RepID=A0ABU6QL71_9FABA|nr:hypothetical protein [Stylosanthes scabra]